MEIRCDETWRPELGYKGEPGNSEWKCCYFPLELLQVLPLVFSIFRWENKEMVSDLSTLKHSVKTRSRFWTQATDFRVHLWFMPLDCCSNPACEKQMRQIPKLLSKSLEEEWHEGGEKLGQWLCEPAEADSLPGVRKPAGWNTWTSGEEKQTQQGTLKKL